MLVPRGFGKMLKETEEFPLGAIWDDTQVELPAELATIGWHEYLTDTPFSPGEPGYLELAQVFKLLPYALLGGTT